MTISPGTRIKELRLLSGMSQEELGRRVGVQRAAINKYEKGTVTNIPIQTIEKMAQVFDVSPTYIVGWNGDNENPLAAEVKVLTGVKQFFGAGAVDLLASYTTLNSKGQKRLLEYAWELEKIVNYHSQ
jgi:transcriptional regulator with XRE-family HTH domain